MSENEENKILTRRRRSKLQSIMSPRAECLDCEENINDLNSWDRLKEKLLTHHRNSEWNGCHQCAGFRLYRRPYQLLNSEDEDIVGWAACENGRLVEWEFFADLNPHQPPNLLEE